LEGGHPVPVYQDSDRGLLARGDLVRGQDYQLGAAGRGQRASGGGGEGMMGAPSGHEQADQVDIQEPGGLSRGLGDGGFAGRFREVLEGAA
jgi:hypothetical protein